MFGWLRSFRRRRRSAGPDPAAELERERRLAEADSDRDRFADKVREDESRRATTGVGVIHLP